MYMCESIINVKYYLLKTVKVFKLYNVITNILFRVSLVDFQRVYQIFILLFYINDTIFKYFDSF